MRFAATMQQKTAPDMDGMFTFLLEIDSPDYDARGPLTLTAVPDDYSPNQVGDELYTLEEEAVRRWLKHQATGMFGHGLGNDQALRPSDLHAALGAETLRDRWIIHILEAHPRTVTLDLPPGAVS